MICKDDENIDYSDQLTFSIQTFSFLYDEYHLQLKIMAVYFSRNLREDEVITLFCF